jgi:hypothetical protein
MRKLHRALTVRYRLVSAAKVNQTYTSRGGRMLSCTDRTPGPLTIVNGHAKYTTETGHEISGTVGPNGVLDLRMMAGAGEVHSRPLEMHTTAQIDSTGTVHARQMGGSCSYDYVWQKQ